MENYIQIKVLGKGSFGSAWLVQRRSDRAQFVAKEVRIASMKPAERESAKHEIDMLRTLNHPNVTRYIDHFEHHGSLFIVMEYANGGDMYTKIKSRKGGRFSEREILHYFAQLCLALLHLHERHILHRDLKTQNVFLTSDGVVKLGDFGISTVLRNTFELKRTVCGTPYYFSPELCLNKPYNNKSDVWALGCILYELTTLTHAFDGSNMKALVQKILKGVYPPIHNSYSSDLSKLISAMLQIDPQLRPNVSQIVSLPYIRDSLSSLQRAVEVAHHDKRACLPTPAEDPSKSPRTPSPRAQDLAARRLEERRRDEQAKAMQLAKERQLQRAQLEQRNRANEERLRQVREQQRAAEAEALQKRKEAEARLREQRRAQERREKAQELIHRQREEAWERNMREQAEDNRRRERERAGEDAPRPPQEAPPSSAAAAAELYREMRRQAALNKRRLLEDVQSGGGEPAQPPPARRPPDADEARRQAFWQMRREAEENKRRALGIDEAPPAVHARRLSQLRDASPAADALRRAEDYSALQTVICAALSEKPSGAGDFCDMAFPDADPTRFMLDGQTIVLPNVNATDPLMHRIESLRLFLEGRLGDAPLMACYKQMNNIAVDDDEAMQRVADLLPEEHQKYIPVVAQLIVCEDAFNRQLVQ